HGGTMKASSQPNKGSVFTFTLKLAVSSGQQSGSADQDHTKQELWGQDQRGALESAATGFEQMAAASVPASALSHPSHPQPSPLPGLSLVLAVDDDPVNLKVLESIFAAEPYEIVTATSGKEALALLDQRSYDLVISDVMMPSMS